MVELLVAMVLGLFLLGGIVSIFSSSRQTFRVNENLARVQENARFSFEVLMREIREAGTVPCGSRKMANVVSAAPAWWADWDGGTVIGYNQDEAAAQKAIGTSTGDRVAGTDAISILRPVSDESAIQTVSAHDTGTKKITVSAGGPYAAGDVITLCDADSSVLLKVAGVAGNVLDYATTNCSINLGYPTPPACAALTPKAFVGGTAAKFDPVFWYIGKNAAGGSSLYRIALAKTNVGGVPTPTPAAQEMVTNVADMQIEYLTRDAGSVTPISTVWIDAKTLSGKANGWKPAATEQVVAVRVTLTFLTDEKVGSDGNAVQRKYVAVSSLRARDIP
jgi:type IV pilus assembly protein PilW